MAETKPDCILSFEIEHKDGAAFVHLHGRLVSEVGGNFYTRMRQLMPEHKRIVLDLSDIAYMDSMGLGTLVRLVVSGKSAGCSVDLYKIGPRVKQLLGLTHLLGCFSVVGENGVTLGF
jgi:anti-sigma B factor antagonist